MSFRHQTIKLCLSALFAFLFASLVTPQPAIAQDSITDPQYYRVTGVAAGDVLNVRDSASASSAILGGLQPGAAPVEVFETSGNWGRIVFAEANGWVSLSFLTPLAVATVADTRLPVRLMCNGTEPFWSLEIISPTTVAFDSAAGDAFTNTIVASGSFAARPNADFIWAEGEDNQAAMSFRRQICSDGMSDRDYPTALDLIIRGTGGTVAYTGCCVRFPDAK